MPASKIVDAQEVLRWFEEGRTYAWMTEQYRRKYDVETTPSLWGNFRRRRGLDARIVRDDQLIPWRIAERHYMAWPVQMLRMEARARAGLEVSGRREDVARHRNFVDRLRTEGLVVHYDPDTPEGFHLVPRQHGDEELIRPPAPEARTAKAGRG